jgi:hypothetical protein
MMHGRLVALLFGLTLAQACERNEVQSTDEHAGHIPPIPQAGATAGAEPSGPGSREASVSVGGDEASSADPVGDPHAGHRRDEAPIGDPHAGHRPDEGDTAPALPAPPGYAVFNLDGEKARAVGLRAAPVEERTFSKRIRTTGIVVVDETRTSHVHAKVRGWVESVSVDFVGKPVARGAPLCSIYSQEVLGAQLEFLSVLDQVSLGSNLSGPFGDRREGSPQAAAVSSTTALGASGCTTDRHRPARADA